MICNRDSIKCITTPKFMAHNFSSTKRIMNTNTSNSPSTKIDRKTIERNRRNHMKCLYSQLNSLVHHDSSSSKETLPLTDQIDEAIKFIGKLNDNVTELKRKKESLPDVDQNYSSIGSNSSRRGLSLNSPVQIEVHDKGSAIEVTLVTGLECQFVFTEAIRILHEEHTQVVNASYSVVGSAVFHSIHAQIGENATSHGVARITERLKRYAL